MFAFSLILLCYLQDGTCEVVIIVQSSDEFSCAPTVSIEPSGITAFRQLECRASKLCDTVGAHKNSSLNWTMITTSQVPSCRFLKVCAAKIFVEARFSGDQNYGMSESCAGLWEILSQICTKRRR